VIGRPGAKDRGPITGDVSGIGVAEHKRKEEGHGDEGGETYMRKAWRRDSRRE